MLSALIAAGLFAQPGAPVPVERRVMLTGFDRVRIDGPFEVTIATGVAPAARIVGVPSAVVRVQIRVEGTMLIVAPVHGAPGEAVDRRPLPTVALAGQRLAAVLVRGGARIAVDRMAGTRIELSLTGDGAIDVAAIDADAVQATLIGAGRLRIAGRGGQARFTVNGSGDVDAAALVADDLSVVGTGSGTGRYQARYTADIGASGTGSVTVAGTPQCRTRGRATIRCGR